jgi:hypothetical protein
MDACAVRFRTGAQVDPADLVGARQFKWTFRRVRHVVSVVLQHSGRVKDFAIQGKPAI